MVDDTEHTQDLEKQNLEAVLASEINKLSLNDRNHVQEELHCCSSMAVKETPHLLEQSIFEIRQRTTKIVLSVSVVGSKEFQQTFASNLGFVHCHAVCLRYLRVDFFRVEPASKRMVNHFELLFRYYGTIALQRPLRLSDLDRAEQDAFRGGSVQFLPCRDKAGRLIIVHQGSIEGTTVYQRLRMMLYYHCVMSEDVDTQKHGLSIVFAVNEKVKKYVQNTSRADLSILYANLPFRMAATHLCMPSGPAFQFIKAFWIMALASQDQRTRTKFHGELYQLETQYELMSYGIPVSQLPCTSTGNVKIKNQLQWIKTRHSIDQARQTMSDPEDMYNSINIISNPCRSDVLFSKGGNSRHYGNMMMLEDIAARLERFNQTTDAVTRHVLRDEIMSAVTERGGRFLTLSKRGWWEELPDDKAHDKITSAFYDYKKRKKEPGDHQRTASLGNATTIFLSRTKRQKIAVEEKKGCFCFHDPFEGGKMVNPFA